MSILSAKINNSEIYFFDIPCFWYKNNVELLAKKLSESDCSINLIVSRTDEIPCPKNGKKDVRVFFHDEHTLVKPGLDEFDSHQRSKVENYLIHFWHRNKCVKSDYVFEYSSTNISNLSSNSFDDYVSKVHYLAPLLPINFDNSHKQDTITTFISLKEVYIKGYLVRSRRQKFYDMILSRNIQCNNITGYWTEQETINLYNTVKILVNIRQSDYYWTFEELRCLPALCRGVIVISEDVPLREEIPYHKHILWGKFDELPDIILEVQNNYQKYYNELINDDLRKILEDLSYKNEKNIQNIQL